MNIGILIIGDEILTGRRQDQHFAHMIETLAKRGLELQWARYVSDDEQQLIRQIGEIRSSGELCFTFGGIGATLDDRTRQAVAAAYDVTIERHAEAAREIVSQFGDGAYPNRILMADLPRGAILIPNPFNRIPGFSLGHIHCLPGFPEMAWPMLEWVLDTRYPDLRYEKPLQCILTVHGVYESELIDVMNAVQAKHPDVKLSSLPRYLPNAEREVELGVRGEGSAASAALRELERVLTTQNVDFTRKS